MGRHFYGFLLSLIVTLWCAFSYPSKRPIIGVVLETVDPEYDSLCHAHPGQKQAMQTTYKSYIEQAGGGAIPIFVNKSDDYYAELFSRINGVLFPGGGVNLVSSYYGKVAEKIFQHGKSSNQEGNYFPIWGTCLGMQEMTTWPFNPRIDALSNCSGTGDVSLSLNFTTAAAKSKMYKDLPEELRDGLSKYDLTPNYHSYCLSMKTYRARKELSDFYVVTSTNDDKKGLTFASTIEARDYPFYAVQWHPEKINFWPAPNHLNQSALAVRVSQYFANFLIAEASKSKNAFKSYEEEGRFLLNNYATTFNSNEQLEYYCLRRDQTPKFDD